MADVLSDAELAAPPLARSGRSRRRTPERPHLSEQGKEFARILMARRSRYFCPPYPTASVMTRSRLGTQADRSNSRRDVETGATFRSPPAEARSFDWNRRPTHLPRPRPLTMVLRVAPTNSPVSPPERTRSRHCR